LVICLSNHSFLGVTPMAEESYLRNSSSGVKGKLPMDTGLQGLSPYKMPTIDATSNSLSHIGLIFRDLAQRIAAVFRLMAGSR
jgi:hypothetical protein